MSAIDEEMTALIREDRRHLWLKDIREKIKHYKEARESTAAKKVVPLPLPK